MLNLKIFQKVCFITLGMLCLSAKICLADKILLIDSDLVLQSLPEYENIQKQVELYAVDVQKEIAKRNNEIQELQESLKREQLVLSEKARRKREEDIAEKILDLQKYQEAMFGDTGTFFQQRRLLMSSLNNKMYRMVEEIANERGGTLVLDKSNKHQTIVYSNGDNDITQSVIERLRIDLD